MASGKFLRNAARSRRPESMESQEFAIEHVPIDHYREATSSSQCSLGRCFGIALFNLNNAKFPLLVLPDADVKRCISLLMQ